MSIRQALELGLRIDNPELQGQVAQERRLQLRPATAKLRARYDAMRLGKATRWCCAVRARAGGGYEYTITDTLDPDREPIRTPDAETAAREMATRQKIIDLDGPVSAGDVAEARASIREAQRGIERERSPGGS